MRFSIQGAISVILGRRVFIALRRRAISCLCCMGQTRSYILRTLPMRRLTAMLVLLYFLLLAGATVFAASDDAVPPCCRGNGAHHCNRRPLRGSGTQISPANLCPYRVGHSAVTSWVSVLEPPHILPGMGVGIFLPSEYSGALLHELIRTAADRGPPAPLS